MITRLLKLSSLFFCLLTSISAHAQSVKELRGGWIADQAGERHVLYIVLRDDTVSGTYCYDCENPYNLAFIDDGTLGEQGLQFTLYHYPADATPYQEQVVAEFINGELHLNISGAQANDREMTLHRTKSEDIVRLPNAAPENTTGLTLRSRERILPGGLSPVNADTVVGLWLWGTGPGKQHFIFREHKNDVRGMVCGPCDSAPDFAPLEGVTLNGSDFHFEIVHEDNGFDFEIYGPHSNVVEAQISEHEMHMSITPSFEEPGFTPIEMTLLGPIDL